MEPSLMRMLVCLLLPAVVTTRGIAADAVPSPVEIKALAFDAGAVYLSVPRRAADGSAVTLYYRLDRKTSALSRVAAVPADAQGMPLDSKTVEENVESDPFPHKALYLLTSEGDLYRTAPFSPYGSDNKLYTSSGELLSAPSGNTQRVTSVERYHDLLLVGTIGYGSRGDQPGDGLMVLDAKTGALQRTIGQDDGLSESLIHLVRRDPVTDHIWVETPYSLAELSPKLEVSRVLYLHRDFDAAGMPALVATSQPEYDNPYLVLAEQLGVQDFAAYRQAVAQISAADRDALLQQAFPNGGQAYTKVPKALNVLLPFFIDSAMRSAGHQPTIGLALPVIGLTSLCYFDDPRARAAVDKLMQGIAGPADKGIFDTLRSCADQAAVAAAVAKLRIAPSAPMGNYGYAPPTRYQSNGSTGAIVQTMVMGAARRLETALPMVLAVTPSLFFWDGRQKLHVRDLTINWGPVPSAPTVTRYYLRPVQGLDPGPGAPIAERPLPALQGGQKDSHEMDVTLPAGIAKGLYYVEACADDHRDPVTAFKDGKCALARDADPPPGTP